MGRLDLALVLILAGNCICPSLASDDSGKDKSAVFIDNSAHPLPPVNLLQTDPFCDYVSGQQNAIFSGNHELFIKPVDVQVGSPTVFDKMVPSTSTKPASYSGFGRLYPSRIEIPVRSYAPVQNSESHPCGAGDFYADKCYWGRELNNNLELPCPHLNTQMQKGELLYRH